MKHLILLLLLAIPALCQSTTGAINGAVRDPSGAILPGTKVSVINETTGLRRETTTNIEGLYNLPLLPVGAYSLTVEREGFKRQVQKGIRIEIQQVREVDFDLELGAVTDTVSVESRAPLLETQTSQAGQVIRGEQVNNLPLNVRQFMQLAFLVPMVTPATSDYRSVEVNRDITAPAAAGQRPEQNNYQIDGIDNRESGRNNVAVGVPVDSVGEFKVQTGVSPAEFGRGGGLILNVATRTGSNNFHGSAYEFLRNDRFDARPFFSSRVSPLKRNQYGAALGGPIVRDKLFFFGNYEGLRQAATGNPPVGVVLTEQQRSGVFPNAIVDPANGRTPFANNTIPSQRINPISQKIAALLPRPNNADPLRNFIFNGVPSGLTGRDYVVNRIDYNPGAKDTFYGRYLFNQESQTAPPTLPAPLNSGGRRFGLRAQSASAHWNRMLSASMINSLSVGYTRYRNILQTLNSFNQDFVTTSGITNTLSAVNPLFWAAPSITVPGYLMPSEVTPNFRTMNNYQLQENILWNRGRHTIKFGADTRQIRTYMFYTGGNGSTSFGNRYTGDPVADFLLGYASSVNKTARATNWNSRMKYVGAYIQDDWKITSRLTLNLGFRYEVESALQQIDNGAPRFDMATGAILVSKDATNLAPIQAFYQNIRPDIPLRVEDNRRAPYNADTNNFAPRIGFAYNFASKMVLRGGYGIFYDAPQIQALASANDFAPNTLRPIWTADPLTPNMGYNPEGNTAAEQTLRNAPLTLFPFLSRHFPYGKIQQWSLSVQRQLSSSLVVEALYQGSNSVNLLLLDNVNVRAPGPGNVQQLLPYPGFARVAPYDTWGRANYNGVAVKLEQRLWHGLSYLVSYAYTKSIDTGSSFDVNPAWVDPLNKRTARGPSDFDDRNRFTAAYQYSLPIGKGKALDVNGWQDKALGGWGVRGLTTFQTGLPQSPSMSIARQGTCVATCIARPDRIGDGNLDKGEQTLSRFYDVNAFRLLAQGGIDRRVGNAGRNVLNSPGINNWDLQVFKETVIREGQSLEFRWETFNSFNHTQWGSPGVNLEAPTQFGVVSSTRSPRIMQFVLRYAF